MPQPLREFSQIAPRKSNPNGTSRKPIFTLSPYDNRTAPRSATRSADSHPTQTASQKNRALAPFGRSRVCRWLRYLTKRKRLKTRGASPPRPPKAEASRPAADTQQAEKAYESQSDPSALMATGHSNTLSVENIFPVFGEKCPI